MSGAITLKAAQEIADALDISEDAKLPTAEEYLAKVLTNKGNRK